MVFPPTGGELMPNDHCLDITTLWLPQGGWLWQLRWLIVVVYMAAKDKPTMHSVGRGVQACNNLQSDKLTSHRDNSQYYYGFSPLLSLSFTLNTPSMINISKSNSHFTHSTPSSQTHTFKQAALSATYLELTQLASTRHHRLGECKQLHRFNRDCDEVEVWVLARDTVAQSEDVGKDLEHVEVGPGLSIETGVLCVVCYC